MPKDFLCISMDKCNTSEISKDIDIFCQHDNDTMESILMKNVSRCFKRMNQTLGAYVSILPAPSQEQSWNLYSTY